MRCMYLLNCGLVGAGVCVQLINRHEPWDPIPGVAFSFWASVGGPVCIPWPYVFALHQATGR